MSGPAAIGVLARDVGVRLVNCSPSGCLLETSSPMDVGTVGSLRLNIDGQDVTDHIVVVRCQAIEGAGCSYHVGARFLWLAAPTGRTIRRVLGHPTPPAVGDIGAISVAQ